MELNPYPFCQHVAQRLLAHHQTLAVAESCTGGALASSLVALEGCSAWFLGGWVAYSNAMKQRSLGVPDTLLAEYGAVSAECARAMAAGVLANTTADIGLSVTGIAGPSGGTAEKPVGLVWFGYAKRGTAVLARSAMFAGEREQVRLQAVCFVLQWLLEIEGGL